MRRTLTMMRASSCHRYPHVSRWYAHVASLYPQYQRTLSSSTTSKPSTQTITTPATSSSETKTKTIATPAALSAGHGSVFRSSKISELPATPGMAIMALHPDIPFEGSVHQYVEGGGTTNTADVLGAPHDAVFKTMVCI